MNKKKILFVVHHRIGRSPGQRFRFEQYLSALEEAGFETQISNILSEKDDKIFYSPGKYFGKLRIMLKSFFHRMNDVANANADIVFVYREAFMLGTYLFEALFAQSRAKLVFDFDDSIWLNDTSEGNKNLSWLKKPEKTANICKLADTVIVGNDYLADYASQYNKNTVVVPTTIDTDYHKPQEQKQPQDKPICIGWTGTSTTLRHFEMLEPVLERLKTNYGDRICFKLINNAPYKNERLNLETTYWSADSEIDDLCDIDIGIMPLPDDKWANGKCGFKGLQYMALEIPTIMSPVGVNKKIITHGENGFLATTEREWEEVLSSLVESADLRAKIGAEGRKTVQERFSVQSQQERYVELFKAMVN